jgi:hypothetical protein
MRSLVVLLFSLFIKVCATARAKTVLKIFFVVVLSAAHSADTLAVIAPRDFSWFVFGELADEFCLFAS